jgi:hypothetical protein
MVASAPAFHDEAAEVLAVEAARGYNATGSGLVGADQAFGLKIVEN